MPFPFMIVGAAAMGALSMAQAGRSNKAIAKSAKANLLGANEELVQKRLQIFEQSGKLGQDSQSTIGSFLNGVGFGSGGSVNAVIAQMYADSAKDSAALRQELAYSEKANQYSREAIRAGGQAQSQSVGMAGISGAIQGAQLGASLDSAISSWRNQNALSSVLNDKSAPAWKVDAALKGVPPQLLSNPAVASYLSASYSMNQSISNAALSASQAQQSAAASALRYWEARGGR